MKQSKWFYFILGTVVLTGGFTIFSAQRGDLVAGIFNLVCFAVTVGCLRLVYSSGEEHSDGAWAKILNLRLDMAISRMDTEHSYSAQLSRLTSDRLANLEHKYNELEEKMKPPLPLPLGGLALSGYTQSGLMESKNTLKTQSKAFNCAEAKEFFDKE